MALLDFLFGSQEQKQELPKWYEDAAQANISRAQDISEMGYMPYYGVDVAGFTPMQHSAMQNTNDLARSFGMSVADQPSPYNMVTDPTTGIQGYRSGDIFDQARNELKQRAPAQYDYYNSMVIDPVTGQYGSRTAPGQALNLLDQIGADTSGVNSGNIYSDSDSGGSLVPQAGLSGDAIMKLRAISDSPLMKTGPVSGILAWLLGEYADQYAGDYGKEGQPGVYGDDMFYRSTMSPDTGGNLMPTPVRGSEFYESDEAAANRAKVAGLPPVPTAPVLTREQIDALIDADRQKSASIYSDSSSDSGYSSGAGSLGVGGGNASRGYVTGGL